jgi:hypothetical protein
MLGYGGVGNEDIDVKTLKQEDILMNPPVQKS